MAVAQRSRRSPGWRGEVQHSDARRRCLGCSLVELVETMLIAIPAKPASLWRGARAVRSRINSGWTLKTVAVSRPSDVPYTGGQGPRAAVSRPTPPGSEGSKGK